MKLSLLSIVFAGNSELVYFCFPKWENHFCCMLPIGGIGIVRSSFINTLIISLLVNEVGKGFVYRKNVRCETDVLLL